MIAQPELWRMMLMVSDSRLEVALYPPVAREELIWRSFRFEPSAASTLKAIEDVIYDNPLLLSDFKSIGCIVDCGTRIAVPSEADENDCRLLLEQTCSGDYITEGDVEIFSTGTANANISLIQDPGLKAFLTRTFYNIRFVERKAALCRYFTAHHEGMASARVYVIMHGDVLTLIAIDGDRLLAANDFRCRSAADAAYYVLACIKTAGLDPHTTDVALSGEPDFDGSPESILRQYLPNVRPVPFPMLRYRVSKHTLKAPIDLLISQQCE